MAKKSRSEPTELKKFIAHFALTIRDARERAGLSQRQLADRIDVSLDHVSKIEREKYLPGLEIAAALVRALEIDANALLAVTPAKRQVSRRRLEVEADLMRTVEALDDRTLSTAADVLAVLAREAKGGR